LVLKRSLKKVNKLLAYAIMLDSLLVAYVQFVVMLIELKKVLSAEITLNANSLKQSMLVYVARLPQFCWNELYQEIWV